MTNVVSRFLTGVLVVVGLAACGGSSESNTNPNPGPNPPAPTSGTVSGVVVASGSGQLLGGVAVTAGGRSTTTDVSGRFTLTSVPAGNPVVVKFDLNGYIRGVSSVTLAGGGSAVTSPRLTAVATTQQFDAASGAVVNVPNSSGQVSLPANGLVNPATGAAASGSVSAEVTPIDPAADPRAMPGNFQAAGNAAPITIESFGALSVVLRDGTGNTLNLAAGRTATVRIPVASRSATPPASIPLFYFNESSGLWVEEGTASLRGVAPDQYYEGLVSHFTVWNADRATETVRVLGCLVDNNNQPVQGATVETNGVNYSGRAETQTNANGNFSVPMRRGTSIAALYGQSGGQFSNVQQIGPTDADVNQPVCLRLTGNNAAPAIVQFPQNTAVPLGACATFYVQALGAQPLRYQWRRNGSDVAGGTGSSLSICPTLAADNNTSFTVAVSNNFGAVTSNAAVLTVGAPTPPQIVTQPADQQVQIGATATFSVTAIAAGGTLTYQWQRDGAAIAGATGESYTTPPTTAGDNGAMFRVVVTSTVGGSVTSNNARLTVNQASAPAIAQQPQDASVNVGQSATFSVGATGTPAPAYQWLRDGQAINGANSASYSTPATQLADSGALFSVVVSNPLGSVTSNNARLTVTQPGGGAGYYLIGPAGPTSTVSVTYANGAQDMLSQALMGVRESAPGSGAVTIETVGSSGVVTFGALEGTIGGGQLSNARSRLAIYAKGGRFYKVDQVVTSGTPTPQLVSSLATNEVCGNTGMPMFANLVDGGDWADATRGWLFLRAPGPDQLCSSADDVYRAIRLNMAETTAPVTIGEPLAAIHAATGAFAGLIVRNGNQVQSLDADLVAPTNLFTVNSATFTNAGSVYGTALQGLWLFLDGQTLYGVNLASPGTRMAVATLAAGEVLSSRMTGDGANAYVAINGATSARVLRFSSNLVASDVTALDAPSANLDVTATRVVAVLDSTPTRVMAAPKTGGAAQTIHTAAIGETALRLMTSGENVYLSKLGLAIGVLGTRTTIVGADGSNPQTLENTQLLHPIRPAVLALSQGLNQTYAVLIADGIGVTGDYAGSTMRAVEGATRNTLTTFGSFPASATGVAFIFGSAPMQYGQTGLASFFGATATAGASDLYFLKSDAAGLLRVTSFVTGQ